MSSDKHCCVPGCMASGGSHKVLHGFPHPEHEKDRFNTWLYAVGLDILGLENERIYKYRRVCRSHFAEKYLCRNNRLSKTAVPTLNMPGLTLQTPIFMEQKPMRKVLTCLQPSTSTAPTPPNFGEHINFKSMAHEERKCSEEDKVSEKENCEPIVPTTSNLNVPTKPPPVAMRDVLPRYVSKRALKIKPVLTAKENLVHSMVIAAKRKIRKLKKKVKQQSAQIKAAAKLASNPVVLEVLENSTSNAKLLMMMQFRENRKKEKGRRFTLEEKNLSLCILKRVHASGYKYFRSVLIMPTEQTLTKLVQKFRLRPGLNHNIFFQLKKKAESMKIEEKLCVLLFDEISLKAHVSYNQKKDKITGFVDDGTERYQEFADHAQVFMVRGLIKNYKQAVAYTFSASATKGPALAKQIKEVVSELQKCGLIVVASVCDQGTNNRQALKILLNETRGFYLRKGTTPKDNTILINEQEIIPLYDPPHLLKGIRNNLITKNLFYMKDGVQKIAKWSHLELLHKENPGYQGIRLIPKLTECHINPEKINKMKVKYASQIFSRTVASNMGYLADKGILPAECKDTADLLLVMDNIFDSVNGSYSKNKNAKPLLGPANDKSIHNKTWAEGKQIFKSMRFVTHVGKDESVPTVANWVWTLNGIQCLLANLKREHEITSVWLRHLNQDPIENFFGGIRSHGCRNNNPTCEQFEAAFTSLLINNMTSVHTRGKNCEDDLCKSLYSLATSENPEASSTSTFDFTSILNMNFIPLEEKEKDPKKIAPLQYMSGYFLKKAKSYIFKNCTECKNNLFDTDEIEYIKYREYAGRRWLCTPSSGLVKLISNMLDVIHIILKQNLQNINLKEIIKTSIILLIDFEILKCQVHNEKLKTYIIHIVSRCLVFNYCKEINRILSGKKGAVDEEDNIQIKAKKYRNKCFKRKK